jgi:hypothetical protein
MLNRIRHLGVRAGFTALGGLAALTVSAVAADALAQAKELRIGYMRHPIQEANIAMMEKWAEANGVTLTKIPMAYNLFMERVTANLTSGTDQFDIIWHNDDWGQLWIDWVEPMDDVPGIETVDQWPLLAFYDAEGHVSTRCRRPGTRWSRSASGSRRKARSGGAMSAAWP